MSGESGATRTFQCKADVYRYGTVDIMNLLAGARTKQGDRIGSDHYISSSDSDCGASNSPRLRGPETPTATFS